VSQFESCLCHSGLRHTSLKRVNVAREPEGTGIAPDQHYSASELAKRWHLSPNTMRRLVADDVVPPSSWVFGVHPHSPARWLPAEAGRIAARRGRCRSAPAGPRETCRLDRMVMILADADSLREVAPLPKTAKAVDLMMHAPAPVSDKQPKELGIAVCRH